MDAAVKKKLLQSAISKINKKYGEDVILDTQEVKKYDVISTGSLLLDSDLGIGGLPMGKIVECAGPSGSGKSSMAYSLIAQAQKAYPDKIVVYCDIEYGVNLSYMEQFGVDITQDKLLFFQPEYIEKAFETIEELVSTGLVSLVVLDSIGNSVTKTILDKGYDEATMGSLAKACATGLTKLNSVLGSTNTLLFLINTEYAKMSYTGGNETKGGATVKYLPSIRFRITKRDLLTSETDKDTVLGQELYYKIIKNRMGAPFKEGSTILYFGKGFDQVSEIVELTIKKELIQRAGAWYNFEIPEKKGSKKMIPMKFQGKDNVINFFRNDENAFEYLKELCH